MNALLALAVLLTSQAPTSPPPEPSALTFLSDLSVAFDLARYERRPVFLHLSAPWCEPCKTLKEDVYTAPEVRALLERFIRVELDVESPRGKRAWMAYGVSALPTALVLREDAACLNRFRVTGVLSPQEMVTLLEGAVAATDAPPAARRDGGLSGVEGEGAPPDSPPWANYLWFVGCGLIMASLWMKFKQRYAQEPDQ